MMKRLPNSEQEESTNQQNKKIVAINKEFLIFKFSTKRNKNFRFLNDKSNLFNRINESHVKINEAEIKNFEDKFGYRKSVQQKSIHQLQESLIKSKMSYLIESLTRKQEKKELQKYADLGLFILNEDNLGRAELILWKKE
jgi:hypothetical protein